jgi:hypothetical protein
VSKTALLTRAIISIVLAVLGVFVAAVVFGGRSDIEHLQRCSMAASTAFCRLPVCFAFAGYAHRTSARGSSTLRIRYRARPAGPRDHPGRLCGGGQCAFTVGTPRRNAGGAVAAIRIGSLGRVNRQSSESVPRWHRSGCCFRCSPASAVPFAMASVAICPRLDAVHPLYRVPLALRSSPA